VRDQHSGTARSAQPNDSALNKHSGGSKAYSSKEFQKELAQIHEWIIGVQ